MGRLVKPSAQIEFKCTSLRIVGFLNMTINLLFKEMSRDEVKYVLCN